MRSLDRHPQAGSRLGRWNLICLGVALMGCVSSRSRQPENPALTNPQPPVVVTRAAPAIEHAGLKFKVEPPDAEIFINGKSMGRANSLQAGLLDLGPGLYQVSVKKAGFQTWRAEVAVKETPEPIDVILARSQR